MDLQKLIKALQASSTDGATINITVNVVQPEPEPELPDTDFEVGDEVVICHQKKDGTGTKHTSGTVIETLQKDENGWYTRVLGDNGKHYRIGLHYDEERLGSKAIVME